MNTSLIQDKKLQAFAIWDTSCYGIRESYNRKLYFDFCKKAINEIVAVYGLHNINGTHFPCSLYFSVPQIIFVFNFNFYFLFLKSNT